MTGKNKKHVGEEKNQKSKNTLHEKEKNKQKKGENMRDIPSNVRGINGGNLVTPMYQAFTIIFFPKWKNQFLAAQERKCLSPNKNLSTFLSLPNNLKNPSSSSSSSSSSFFFF